MFNQYLEVLCLSFAAHTCCALQALSQHANLRDEYFAWVQHRETMPNALVSLCQVSVAPSSSMIASSLPPPPPQQKQQQQRSCCQCYTSAQKMLPLLLAANRGGMQGKQASTPC